MTSVPAGPQVMVAFTVGQETKQHFAFLPHRCSLKYFKTVVLNCCPEIRLSSKLVVKGLGTSSKTQDDLLDWAEVKSPLQVVEKFADPVKDLPLTIKRVLAHYTSIWVGKKSQRLDRTGNMYLHVDCTSDGIKTALGKGGFGEVFKGVAHIGGVTHAVAVKEYPALNAKRTAEDVKAVVKEDIIPEITALLFLRHRNLVRLCAIGIEIKHNVPVPSMIAMHLCTGGSLWHWLEKGAVGSAFLLPFVEDLLAGVEFLHTHDPRIVHRDIKTTNIFIETSTDPSQPPTLVLGDLGGAQQLKNTLGCASGMASWGYCAPELFGSNPTCSLRTDMFSTGVVILEMIHNVIHVKCGQKATATTVGQKCGAVPVNTHTRHKMVEEAKQFARRVLQTQSMRATWLDSQVFNALLDCSIQSNPMDRVTMQDIKRARLENIAKSSKGVAATNEETAVAAPVPKQKADVAAPKQTPAAPKKKAAAPKKKAAAPKKKAAAPKKKAAAPKKKAAAPKKKAAAPKKKAAAPKKKAAAPKKKAAAKIATGDAPKEPAAAQKKTAARNPKPAVKRKTSLQHNTVGNHKRTKMNARSPWVKQEAVSKTDQVNFSTARKLTAEYFGLTSEQR